MCVVDPVGGKYGFGNHIRLARAVYKSEAIAGLRDRDFDDEDTSITNAPREWHVEGGALWLGWYWERNSIENYLIDPVVVERALGAKAPPASDYRSALQTSAESLADYTAARLALSRSRLRFSPLENSWGQERGHDRHRLPDKRAEVDCRAAIHEIVSRHQAGQIIHAPEVVTRFESALPSCRPGGIRFQNFHVHFSGKDLLYGMEAALAQLGFASLGEFRERILKGIEGSTDNVWTWLPEWSRLRELVRLHP
jgi:hypothetical protein